MARRYTRRYRRGRRYYRRRIPRKRFIRGVDRNTFCIVQGGNITYNFDSNQVIGFPDKYINFAVRRVYIGGDMIEGAIGIIKSDKFVALSKLYDQVRLKGMSVKISYVAATGLSAQTLSLITMVDRSTTKVELINNYRAMTSSSGSKTIYLNKIDNAASRRKVSLTGGKTVYMYYRASGIQERTFLSINEDQGTTSEPEFEYLQAVDYSAFNNFNPCIYSYMEKSAAAESSPTSVIVNVEVKYYVEFRNSC